MIQIIRPLEVRLKTNSYNQLEFQMIVEKVVEIQSHVEPEWILVLNNLFIKDADVLVNGAPN